MYRILGKPFSLKNADIPRRGGHYTVVCPRIPGRCLHHFAVSTISSGPPKSCSATTEKSLHITETENGHLFRGSIDYFGHGNQPGTFGI